MAQTAQQIAADILRLDGSGLFDPAWYRARYPATAGDPLVDFCNTGWGQEQWPNRYFDTAAYLRQNDDVRGAGVNPLVHYADYGAAENRAPSWMFDTAWYCSQNQLAAADALAHYLANAGQQPLSPNPGFDAAWYREQQHAPQHEQHREPHNVTGDAFADYLANAATRDPSQPAKITRESGLFDAGFYLRHYADAAAGQDPAYHFNATGWRLGFWPNPGFDTAWYLDHNDDVRAADINPLYHYIAFGEPEGRRPVPDFDPASYRTTHDIPISRSCLWHFLQTPPDIAPAQLMVESDLFDSNYYLASYPDVRESGLEPATHFQNYGWREGRRPNPYFDPAWYRQTYLAGDDEQNPLLHYITQGEAAGNRPIVYFEPQWYRAHYRLNDEQTPLRHFLQHRRSQQFSPNPWFDAGAYTRAHGEEIGGNRDPFAHYLRVGIASDVDPGPGFDAKTYRAQKMAAAPARSRPMAGGEIHEKLRREALNPLVHFLLHEGQPAPPRRVAALT